MLLFDGVFLQRPELIDRWDLRILVSVPFEQVVDRAKHRATALTGSTADTAGEQTWRNRYIHSQQLYFAPARPIDHADIIVYNAHLQRPTWEARPTHRYTGFDPTRRMAGRRLLLRIDDHPPGQERPVKPPHWQGTASIPGIQREQLPQPAGV